MSMEPILFGVAAPAVASGASTVARAADAVTKSFRGALESAGDLLTPGSGSESHAQAAEQVSTGDDGRLGLLSELLAGASSVDTRSKLSIEDIQADARQTQDDIEKRIEEALDRAGIKLDSPLRLTVSGIDGTFEVDGIHPQRAVIEAALNSDRTLAADFQKLSAERQIVDFYGRSKSFARDFATEPWHAIANLTGRDIQRHEATLEFSNANGRLQLQFD